MIVSWNWLEEYVTLEMSLETLTDRLTMSGLNLEGVDKIVAIDLEVTSNRPDCLGHIGVAREISVLFGCELKIPDPTPQTSAETCHSATSVGIECEELCPQYSARIIRGVKVGPSPQWLQSRLQTLGITPINNVVDVTNYVLMECGQPLHAFDFDKLHGQRIVVRQAGKGEKIVAIDQREYELSPQMCVIADADHPVAIGGVMGGLETEIGDGTVNVLIETAAFAPLSIRNTARALNLHSPSSYRFERGVDRAQLDWASRRCCELILETAGGELLDGCVSAGTSAAEEREPICLRFNQVSRILGISVDPRESAEILVQLGLHQEGNATTEEGNFIPPSWRRDLRREIDLIEEVARIHGYDKIPENAAIPVVATHKSLNDQVTEIVRDVLTGLGFYEAVTMSFVSEEQCSRFTPRGDIPQITVDHSSRRRENVLRQSLIPSLLESRRENERHGTFNAQLFELAKVYLTADTNCPENEAEPGMIGCVTGRGFLELKGDVERLARTFASSAAVTARPAAVPQFVSGRGAELLLNGKLWGWMGELDRSVTDQLDLRDAVTVAELDLNALRSIAELHPIYSTVAQFPSVQRDLNFVLDEDVTWQQLEDIVRSAAGPLLESVSFGGQYRGEQIAAGKKSCVVAIDYRSAERTLTNEEVEQSKAAIIQACGDQLNATLR